MVGPSRRGTEVRDGGGGLMCKIGSSYVRVCDYIIRTGISTCYKGVFLNTKENTNVCRPIQSTSSILHIHLYI